MPRLIDADALSARMYHDAFETDSDMQKWDSGCWIRYKMFENAIADAPTVDAVEVVRCKDCWVFHQDETWNHKKGLCGWFDIPVGVNDFCSMGDRREDAEPVRHGHWCSTWDMTVKCSECGWFAGGKYNYCPHCGAKMDEVEDDT